jgi:hypothetical protein
MTAPRTTYRVAVIPGDGIGAEVLPPALRALDALALRGGFSFRFDHFDWSCRRLLDAGAMMPADGLDQIAGHDAILLGAVGWPDVPDHVSLWGLLIPIRRHFRQYVNLRPIRVLPGLPGPTTRSVRRALLRERVPDLDERPPVHAVRFDLVEHVAGELPALRRCSRLRGAFRFGDRPAGLNHGGERMLVVGAFPIPVIKHADQRQHALPAGAHAAALLG